MAKLSLYFDLRNEKQDGTFPIKFVIRNAGTTAYMSTGYYVFPCNWKNGHIVSTRKNSDRALAAPPTILDKELQMLFSRTQVAMTEAIGVKSSMSASKIRDKIIAFQEGRIAVAGQEKTVEEAFEYTIAKVENVRTRGTYSTTLNFLRSNLKKFSALRFEDIDKEWAEMVRGIMKEELAGTTAHCYFAKLCTVWHVAQENGWAPKNENPFKGLAPKLPATKSRAVLVEDIRVMWRYNPKKDEDISRAIKAKTLGRDFLKIILCLCGMNIEDLYCITEKDVRAGRIMITRHKTDVPISIKIEPELEALIHKYKSSDGRLFGRLLFQKRESVSRCTNLWLGKLRRDFTLYWARHTWASLAAELDVPDRVISMGLAHRYGNPMDNVYITNRDKKLDIANRKILDYIQEIGEFAPKDNSRQ